MVQATDLRNFYDPSRSRRLYGPADRCVFVQRQMYPRSLVVIEIRFQDAAQAGLVQNDHVVGAFAADRADKPLDVNVLPR